MKFATFDLPGTDSKSHLETKGRRIAVKWRCYATQRFLTEAKARTAHTASWVAVRIPSKNPLMLLADAKAPENPRLGPLPVGRVHGTIKLPRTRSLTVVLGTVHTIVSGVKSFCFSTLTSRTTRSPRRAESLTIMSADPRQRATPQCHAASSCCGAGKLEERHSLQLADRLGIP